MPEDGPRAALEALDVFQGADSAFLDRLAAVARPFSLATGDYLFREGDPGDHVSLLASGRLDGILRLPGGRQLEVEPLGAGTLIGEMAVLSARERRFSVRAAEPSTGWSFAAADVAQIGIADQPEVMRRMGRRALARLREQYDRLSGLCATDPPAAKPARQADLDDAGPVVQVEREPGETSYLETVLLFSQFTAAEIEELFGDLRRLDAPRGATIIRAGERMRPLLVVMRGAVETSIRRGGLAARARLAGPGRIVGHLSLMGDEPTLANSRAREHSILLELPRDRVVQIIERRDDTARRFGRALYADVVDALFEAQRPISRMAAAGG